MNEERIIKETTSFFFRIFFNFGPAFISDLNKGINVVKDKKENHALRSVKGRRYTSEENFVLDAKARNGGRTAEMKTTVVKSGRKDLKELVKACKKRGVDIYIREKPDNFNELVERYKSNDNLSIREKEMLDAFCDYDKDGNIINVHDDGGVVMFKSEDIQQVEEAVKDVDQKALNIQRRKQKAKVQFKTQNERNKKDKSITKAKDMRER